MCASLTWHVLSCRRGCSQHLQQCRLWMMSSASSCKISVLMSSRPSQWPTAACALTWRQQHRHDSRRAQPSSRLSSKVRSNRSCCCAYRTYVADAFAYWPQGGRQHSPNALHLSDRLSVGLLSIACQGLWPVGLQSGAHGHSLMEACRPWQCCRS